MTQSISFLENGTVRLCCERRGEGARHVLFAHGWISSRRMWYDVFDHLDPAQFTMHAFDFRGCGRSDRPRDATSFDAYASDLRAALAAIPAPVTLVGHSMGGRFSMFVATERPPNLERLILVAPGTPKAARVAAARRALTNETFGSRERIEHFQRAAMVRNVAPAVIERIVDDALIASHEHWMGVEERGAFDFSDRLSQIAIPTLAIAGSKDPLAPPARVKRDIAGAIEGALYVELRGVGHNLPIEAPDEVAQAVRRFGA
jgi:pimeloyl-ACP methyl ester carboxylesterase